MLSTALFGKPPFKNLIVNGLVLASDGQKMSKKKKNYPDPSLVVNLDFDFKSIERTKSILFVSGCE